MCDVLSSMLGSEACIVIVMRASEARLLGMLPCAASLLGRTLCGKWITEPIVHLLEVGW